MMAANMYRVGDYVFFETSATAPYQIRRIEELNKTATGNVEAKVVCFFRRRDISSNLVLLADRHQNQNMTEEDSDLESNEYDVNGKSHDAVNGNFIVNEDNLREDKAKDSMDENQHLSENQRHLLKHRELFLSRQVETLPATHIRGKCTVTLLNETEMLLSYLNKEDSFFYTFVYDASQKTLLADRGSIRVGSHFQAEIQPFLKEGALDEDEDKQHDELIWSPDNGLMESQMEQFMLVVRSVGTLARALDCSSAIRQPSVVMSAAAASRDVTLFKALQLLHEEGYNLANAMCALTPASGLLLCRDEMEEWSASESNLFEEAMDKYGKDFHDLRKDFLPWKSARAVVEYYYMWKTTDRYVQQKRIKAMEAERKLKQVYIPNYNKPNPVVLYNKHDNNGRGCESCYATTSNQWYAWGPPHMQCRLCANCWIYWKKYGGLKMPTRLEKVVAGQQSGLNGMDAMSSHRCNIAGCDKEFRLRTQLLRHLQITHCVVVSDKEMAAATLEPIDGCSAAKKAKNNKAMLMKATSSTKVARRLCSELLGGTRHCALNPNRVIDSKAASLQFLERVIQLSTEDRHRLITNRRMSERTLTPTLHKLGIAKDGPLPPILNRTPLDDSVDGAKQIMYPANPVALRDFFAVLDEKCEAAANTGVQLSNKVETAPPVKMCVSQSHVMKKRGYEHSNGVDKGPLSKRPYSTEPQIASSKISTLTTSMVSNSINARPEGTSNHVGNKAHSRAIKQYLQVVNKTGQGGSPQDSYLLVTPQVRKARRIITLELLRRAARRPGRSFHLSSAATAAVAALKPPAVSSKTLINTASSNNSSNSSILVD